MFPDRGYSAKDEITLYDFILVTNRPFQLLGYKSLTWLSGMDRMLRAGKEFQRIDKQAIIGSY